MNRLIIAALISIGVTGCDQGSLPTKSEVVSEFKKANPAATVVSAVVSEGDSEHAYWQITYTQGGSSKVHTAEWGARSVGSGSWEIFHTH
jgi:hypothetical protein